jgi:ubiquitin C-terminal hydrolase
MLRAMFTAHCESSPVEIFKYMVKTAMKCRRCGGEREGAREEGIVLHTTLASNMSLQTSIENCWQYELLEGVECVCGARRVDRKFNLDTAPNVLIVALKLNYSDTGAKLLSTVLSEDTVNVGQHRYKIFAVVSHIGRMRVTGHYIAYTERNGNWNCFNDSTVTRSKHWRSELEQDETPCVFFLRKIIFNDLKTALQSL